MWKLLGACCHYSARVFEMLSNRQTRDFEVSSNASPHKLTDEFVDSVNVSITSWKFSEQHLVDCDTSNDGCGGGWYDDAWNYLKSKNGSARGPLYPYANKVSNQFVV